MPGEFLSDWYCFCMLDLSFYAGIYKKAAFAHILHSSFDVAFKRLAEFILYSHSRCRKMVLGFFYNIPDFFYIRLCISRCC